MTRMMSLFAATLRRALIVLPPLILCGFVGAAEDECFSSFPRGIPADFLSKPNIAVVMRVDGGLDRPGTYVSRVTKDSERPWTNAFRNELRESFRGENRFDNSSEFLVLKIIKGDVGPVIVLQAWHGAVNQNALGKLLLVAFEDIQPDGTYSAGYSGNQIYYIQFPLTFNSNSYNESNEFRLPLNCERKPLVQRNEMRDEDIR